jgi:predicted HicB family RNase H-like nuclease
VPAPEYEQGDIVMGGKVVIVYKGLTGEARMQDHGYQGLVVNAPSELTFQGDTISDLQREFTRVIDQYLAADGGPAMSGEAAA